VQGKAENIRVFDLADDEENSFWPVMDLLKALRRPDAGVKGVDPMPVGTEDIDGHSTVRSPLVPEGVDHPVGINGDIPDYPVPDDPYAVGIPHGLGLPGGIGQIPDPVREQGTLTVKAIQVVVVPGNQQDLIVPVQGESKTVFCVLQKVVGIGGKPLDDAAAIGAIQIMQVEEPAIGCLAEALEVKQPGGVDFDLQGCFDVNLEFPMVFAVPVKDQDALLELVADVDPVIMAAEVGDPLKFPRGLSHPVPDPQDLPVGCALDDPAVPVREVKVSIVIGIQGVDETEVQLFVQTQQVPPGRILQDVFPRGCRGFSRTAETDANDQGNEYAEHGGPPGENCRMMSAKSKGPRGCEVYGMEWEVRAWRPVKGKG